MTKGVNIFRLDILVADWLADRFYLLDCVAGGAHDSAQDSGCVEKHSH